MLHTPFYDPEKTYEENFHEGPFGAFADGKVFENAGEPTYEIFGQKVYLPFGIPACPLVNSKFIQAAFNKGFDIITHKTVRSVSNPCHPWPNILAAHPKGEYTLDQANEGVLADHRFKEPLSIGNSFGNPSVSPDIWQEDMKKSVTSARKGQLLLASFQGTLAIDKNVEKYIQDFVVTAKLVKETGVKALELNLSCPNEGKMDLLCFDIERTKRIVEKVKNEIGDTPLLVKLAYFPHKELLEKFVKEVGPFLHGIAAINTISTKFIDINGQQAFPGEGRLRSGISGKAILHFGLEMTEYLKRYREKMNLTYYIIGIGGVTQPKDYEAYKKAGADIVMSAMGSLWNPYLAQEIKGKYL